MCVCVLACRDTKPDCFRSGSCSPSPRHNGPHSNANHSQAHCEEVYKWVKDTEQNCTSDCGHQCTHECEIDGDDGNSPKEVCVECNRPKNSGWSCTIIQFVNTRQQIRGNDRERDVRLKKYTMSIEIILAENTDNCSPAVIIIITTIVITIVIVIVIATSKGNPVTYISRFFYLSVFISFFLFSLTGSS